MFTSDFHETKQVAIQIGISPQIAGIRIIFNGWKSDSLMRHAVFPQNPDIFPLPTQLYANNCVAVYHIWMEEKPVAGEQLIFPARAQAK
jgi:hypothetical protein